MVYSLRNLLISFTIAIIVVMLLVWRTFSSLRSQEREQQRISQSRDAMQKLGPAVINLQEFESVTRGNSPFLNPPFSAQYSTIIARLRNDSSNMALLAAADRENSLQYGQLRDIIHKMIGGTGDQGYRSELVTKFKEIVSELEEKYRESLDSAYGKSISLTRETFSFTRIISALLALVLITGCWFIYRDIKTRRTTEERLKQFNAELEKQVTKKTAVIRSNDEKYRSLFESMSDAYAKVDLSGKIIEFNPAFSNMIGYSDEEIHKLSYKDFTPAKWHDTEYEILQKQVLADGFSEVYEKEYRHKNGRVFPVELRTYLLKDDAGKPKAMWAIIRDISARREYKSKLEASEKKLRQALSSTTDVFYVIDRDYHVTLINETAEKNLRIRWGKQVTVGANVLDLVPEENREELKRRFERTMNGERIEYEVHQPQKELPSWVWVAFTPIVDEEGNVTGAAVTGKDISERRTAEERLRRSEQQLLASIENTPNVAVQWYNEKGEVLFWNHASEFIFGWEASEAYGKTLDQLIFNREESERFFALLKESALSGKTAGPVEFRFTRNNGAEGICISTIFSIPSMEGGQCFACMDVDITEQKRAESELREAEEKFRNLVEQSLVGVYIIQEGKLVYVNPCFAEIFGYTQSEMILESIEKAVHPDDREIVKKNIMARLSGEMESVHYELRGFRKNGETIHVEVFGTRTQYRGKPAIIGTLLNISERKKAEQEKEHVRYLLNERVKELTTLYRISQVFQTQKSIEEILKEIVVILPGGWQYHEITASRIVLGGMEFRTPNFGKAFHEQKASFPTPDGQAGVIEIIYLEQRPAEVEDAFLPEERNLINMVAEMLRIYLDRQHEAEMNKKMQEEILRRKIQEQKTVTRAILNAEETERNKIGRELHDNVNQILASIKLFLKMATEKGTAGRNDLVNRSLTLLDNAIEEIRSLSQNQVTPVKEVDLRELVQTLVDRLNDSTSLHTTFTYEKERTIDDDLKLNIYRIVQEQINNILKYADATEVGINIYTEDNFLRVTVADNGKGFDPAIKRKGIGISNMINRVESFNGELNIVSSPGNGCRIEIWIPC